MRRASLVFAAVLLLATACAAAGGGGGAPRDVQPNATSAPSSNPTPVKTDPTDTGY
jgi:predicted small secreted protein